MHNHGLVAELDKRLGERQGLDGVAQWLVAGVCDAAFAVLLPLHSPHFRINAMVGCRAEDRIA